MTALPLLDALCLQLACGPHDGARLGDLVFSRGRDVDYLRHLACGNDPHLREAARVVLDATGRPGASLEDDLLGRARGAERDARAEGEH